MLQAGDAPLQNRHFLPEIYALFRSIPLLFENFQYNLPYYTIHSELLTYMRKQE